MEGAHIISYLGNKQYFNKYPKIEILIGGDAEEDAERIARGIRLYSCWIYQTPLSAALGRRILRLVGKLSGDDLLISIQSVQGICRLDRCIGNYDGHDKRKRSKKRNEK